MRRSRCSSISCCLIRGARASCSSKRFRNTSTTTSTRCALTRAAPEEERIKHPIDLVLQSTTPRRFDSELSFGMIMNLVSALGTSDRELIWNYLTRLRSEDREQS